MVSTSGPRQVLSLPEVSKAHQGTFACVAENDAGRAICQANLRVEGTLLYPIPHFNMIFSLSVYMPVLLHLILLFSSRHDGNQ